MKSPQRWCCLWSRLKRKAWANIDIHFHQRRLKLLSWLQKCKQSHDRESGRELWRKTISQSRTKYLSSALSREQQNIWGQWALAQATSLPWLRAPSHPFTFLAAADTMVCKVRSLTGTDRSQVPGPLSRFGSQTPTLCVQRSGLDLRITHSESDFTWTWSVVNLE